MFKSPTFVTRPNLIHQTLQLQEIDTRADRTWPLSYSRRVVAPQPSAKRPYLLTKSLNPTRRLPSPPFGLTDVAAAVPPLSGFVYSTTTFFTYTRPKEQIPLGQAQNRNAPQDSSKHKQQYIVPEVPIHKTEAASPAQQPRTNKYKRLRRDASSQLHANGLESQRNTIAFPSSSLDPVEDMNVNPTEIGTRKRSRAGFSSSSQMVDAKVHEKSLGNYFCNSVVSPKKKSRRPRVFGRKFPAQSFVPSLESIDEKLENLPSFE